MKTLTLALFFFSSIAFADGVLSLSLSSEEYMAATKLHSFGVHAMQSCRDNTPKKVDSIYPDEDVVNACFNQYLVKKAALVGMKFDLETITGHGNEQLQKEIADLMLAKVEAGEVNCTTKEIETMTSFVASKKVADMACAAAKLIR